MWTRTPRTLTSVTKQGISAFAVQQQFHSPLNGKLLQLHALDTQQWNMCARFLDNKIAYYLWCKKRDLCPAEFGEFTDETGFAGQKVTGYILREIFKRQGVARLELQQNHMTNLSGRLAITVSSISADPRGS